MSTARRLLQRLPLLLALLSLPALAEKPGRLAIIIDDVGYNYVLGKRTAELPGPYTLAILPLTPHAHSLALLASASRKELILHTPMSNTRALALGPGALTTDMNRQVFLTKLKHILTSVPGISGLNNHMGSQLTQDPQAMGWLMTELRNQGLYFIDSRTSAQSLAWQVAKDYGLATAKRDVFLDHERDLEHIRRQLERAVQIARRDGQAIAIGHPYPETLQVLETIGENWDELGVELVAASSLTGRHPPSRGTCLAPPASLRQHVAPWSASQTPSQVGHILGTLTLTQLNYRSPTLDKVDINRQTLQAYN